MDDLYIRLTVEGVLEKEYTKAFDENSKKEWGEKEIKFFLDVMSNCNISPEEYDDVKNAEESKLVRLEADKLFNCVESPFTEQNCVRVLKVYNRSIAHAPPETEELAVAYAARSVIFMKLKKYKLCIEDVDTALGLTCPQDVRAHLYVRKVECLHALGDSKAKASIEDARLLLEHLDVTHALRKKLMEKLNSTKLAKNVGKSNDPKQLPLPRITNPNTEAPCASDAVAIAYNEEHGRHLVATRDIKQGELLIVEKPYTMVLELGKMYTHCSNCFETCWASIPCDYCTSVMYCSEDCKVTNWQKYHDIECAVFSSVMMSMQFTEINLCSLRLTILALRELGSIEKLKEGINEVDNCTDPRTKGFSQDGVLTGDKYRNVLGLAVDTEKISKEELLILALNSCYMLYYLAAQSNLFGNPVTNLLPRSLATNNDAMFFGIILLRHLQLIRTHGQSIYEESKLGNWIKCGFGILPFSSIMNHRHDPNTEIQHKSENGPLRCAVRRIARNIIKKGEQLFDSCCLYDDDSFTTVEDTQCSELINRCNYLFPSDG